MKKMGQRIHDKRKELGLTQEELGKKLDPPVKRQAVCKWENGETGEIKRSYIDSIRKSVVEVDKIRDVEKINKAFLDNSNI